MRQSSMRARRRIYSIEVTLSEVTLEGKDSSIQLLVTGYDAEGRPTDLTHEAEYESDSDVVRGNSFEYFVVRRWPSHDRREDSWTSGCRTGIDQPYARSSYPNFEMISFPF